MGVGSRRCGIRLVVAGRGDALIRLQATVQLRCRAGPTRTGKIAALNTTDYGRIGRAGKSRLGLTIRGTVLRPQQFALAGTFERAKRRARGILRIGGRAAGGGRCGSGQIAWTARLPRAAPA